MPISISILSKISSQITILLTLMLKTKEVELAAKNSRPISENITIDEVGGSSKVGRAEFWVDSWAKLSKSKNKIRLNLAQS